MRHIFTYSDHVNEMLTHDERVWHVGPQKFASPETRPMWFALERSHSDAWFQNTLYDNGHAHQYSARVNGDIVHIDDVRDQLEASDIDPREWIAEVVGNPDSDEVLALEGTQMLMSLGYSGVIYPDYDPRDFQKDLDALLVFDPRKSLSDFRLERSA